MTGVQPCDLPILEAYKNIPGWDKQDLSHPSEEVTYLDHGYDESKPREEWELSDMQKAAEFRGGKCLSENMTKGDFATPLKWECQFGHTFMASPTLVLLGGHWCPECLPSPWNYDEIARGNKFFAQALHPLPGYDEHMVHGEDIFDYLD